MKVSTLNMYAPAPARDFFFGAPDYLKEKRKREEGKGNEKCLALCGDGREMTDEEDGS